MLGELSYIVSGLADFDTAEASSKAIEIRLDLEDSSLQSNINTLIGYEWYKDGTYIRTTQDPWLESVSNAASSSYQVNVKYIDKNLYQQEEIRSIDVPSNEEILSNLDFKKLRFSRGSYYTDGRDFDNSFTPKRVYITVNGTRFTVQPGYTESRAGYSNLINPDQYANLWGLAAGEHRHINGNQINDGNNYTLTNQDIGAAALRGGEEVLLWGKRGQQINIEKLEFNDKDNGSTNPYALPQIEEIDVSDGSDDSALELGLQKHLDLQSLQTFFNPIIINDDAETLLFYEELSWTRDGLALDAFNGMNMIPVEGLVDGDYRFVATYVDGELNRRTVESETYVYQEGFDMPTDIQINPNMIEENSSYAQELTISTIDQTEEDNHFYTLVEGLGDSNNDLFSIDGSKLVFNETANHESQSFYRIRLRTEDSTGFTFEKPLLIQVKDINEAPSNISLNYSAGNLESYGSLLGKLEAYDQDAGDEHSFELVVGTGSDQNDLFRIDGDEIHLKSPEQYETIPAFSIRVRTTDEAGLTHEEVIKNEYLFLQPYIEDAFPTATRVSDFLGRDYGEGVRDYSESTGIAIVGNFATHDQGEWQWSNDGITWFAIPANNLSESNSLYLHHDDLLRFLARADINGAVGGLDFRQVSHQHFPPDLVLHSPPGVIPGDLYFLEELTTLEKVPGSSYPYEGPRPSIVTGDLDNDGDFDLLLGDAANSIHLWTNQGGNTQPRMQYHGIIDELAGANSIGLADIDEDGLLDIVYNDNNSAFFYRTQIESELIEFSSTPELLFDSGSKYYSHRFSEIIDIDGDSDIDVIVASGSKIILFSNQGRQLNGEFAFEESVLYSAYASLVNPDLSAGDINNDGFIDIVIGADYTGVSRILYGPEYAEETISIPGAGGKYQMGVRVDDESSYAWHDSDNDGDLDAFYAENYNRSLSIKLSYLENLAIPDIESRYINIESGMDQGTISSSSVQLGLLILPVDDPAVLSGDIYNNIQEDKVLSGLIVASDTIDGLTRQDVFTIDSQNDAIYGSVEINVKAGQWSYVPNPNFHGADIFTITVTDDDGHDAHQEIRINVASVDDPVLLIGDSYFTIEEETKLTSQLSASDLADGLTDGDYFSITDLDAPSNGTAEVHKESGVWSYEADEGFNGYDQFKITVTDDDGYTATHPVEVRVIGDDGDATFEISGDVLVNQAIELLEDLPDPDGYTGISYLWELSSDGSEWMNVGRNSIYRLIPGDEGMKLRGSASYVDDEGYSVKYTTAIQQIPFVDNGDATFRVNGTALVGETLTIAKVNSDPDGDGITEIQWQSKDGDAEWSDLDSTSDLLLDASFEGHWLRALVSYTDTQGFEESITVDAGYVAITDDGDASFLVSGNLAIDQSLSVQILDEDADGTGELTHLWQSSTDGIEWSNESTEDTLEITSELLGKQYRVVTTYDDLQGFAEEVITYAGNTINDGAGVWQVKGLPHVGHTLTLAQLAVDPDGADQAQIYWQISDDGSTWEQLADTGTLFVSSDYEGQQLRSVVSYEDGHGWEEEVIASGGVVPFINDGNAIIEITGQPALGNLLEASIKLEDPDGGIANFNKFNWYKLNEQSLWEQLYSSSNSHLFSPTRALIDSYIKVSAGYQDAQGFQADIESDPVLINAPYQRILAHERVIPLLDSYSIDIPLYYKSNQVQGTNGITIDVHYDSSILKVREEVGVLFKQDAWVTESVMLDDIEDLDSDQNTDKLIRMSWVDTDNGFVPTGDQVHLATIAFEPTPSTVDPITGDLDWQQNQSTSLNITPHGLDEGMLFSADTIQLKQILPSLDVDGDGRVGLYTDGIMIIRKLIGLESCTTGFADDYFNTNNRYTAERVDSLLDQAYSAGTFDFDQNGSTSLYTDGILMIRHLISPNLVMSSNDLIGDDSPFKEDPSQLIAALNAMTPG